MRPAIAARRALTIAALAAAIAPSSASAASGCVAADLLPTADTLRAANDAVLCLLNQERTRRGLRRLRTNDRLQAAAKRHSISMRERGFFDHSSPTGTTPLMRVKAAGYLSGRVRFQLGENIGWGGGILGTPAAMVDAWMHSPGHRMNILHRRFREIGIGIAIGDPEGGDGVTYTTDFGVRS